MKGWDHSKPWYHGSPFRLTFLRKGSTITQDRELAKVFSHRPTLVSMSEKGVKHDGKTLGFLYRIVEDLKADDIFPHPRSSMPQGKEWLTTRELEVELICETRPVEKEQLTEEEIAELKSLLESKRKTTKGK